MTDPKIESPCPFCGITAKDHDEGSPMISMQSEIDVNVELFAVRCGACGARGPWVCSYEDDDDGRDLETEAIEAWNARVDRNPA